MEHKIGEGVGEWHGGALAQSFLIIHYASTLFNRLNHSQSYLSSGRALLNLISYCARWIIWQTSNSSIDFVKPRTAYLTIRAIPIQDLFSSKQLETLSGKKHDV